MCRRWWGVNLAGIIGDAMKVTTDAVQVPGGAGYTKDFPVEPPGSTSTGRQVPR